MVQPGDIAYLWPSASLDTHRILHDRGIPVVLEGINTRMKSARRILDTAYEAFGAPPAHGITDARIAEEEAKYTYASAIFAPNRNVEAALHGSPLEHRIISASYGVDTRKASPPRDYTGHDRPLTFMFCGYACVRKGMHHLLDAWARVQGPHRLQIVGHIEPLIAERYARSLASDRIERVGFVGDVHPYFARADVFVFPSLEEGGPQVTYEAALHGLPIIASPMGASRLGDTPGTMLTVDPADTEALAGAIDRLATSPALRQEIGRTARAAAFGFDWNAVGQARAERLCDMLA
jgi:glycosyltransferase involved in cell wall biosynthesis